MSLGSELREARILKKMGQKDVAERLDVTVQAVSQWERDKTLPSAFNLLRLSQLLDVDIHNYSLTIGDLAAYPETGMTVPLVSDFESFQFGRDRDDQLDEDPSSFWNEFSEMEGFKTFERLVINWKPKGHVMAYRLSGSAMEPQFHDGDIVIIDSGIDPTPGDFVFAQIYPGQTAFRKYRVKGRAEEGRPIIELVPLNNDYPTETIVPGRPVGMEQRGEITGCLRELRRFSHPK